MKRVLACLIILSTVLTCSCSSDSFKSDQEIAQECISSLLDTLKNEDKDALRALFSEKAVKDADDLDNNIDKIFEYFEGSEFSYDAYSPLEVSKSRDESIDTKIIYSTYDVTTDKDTYRIAIKDVIYDTYHEENEGIYSLYIIRMDDDTDPEYSYRGDNNYTVGINIGIKNHIPA